jgi:large subunit ribosomal protein L9
MDVILLERIPRLGQMGDTVRVKDGYARNFLLPQGKALRSNADNLARFENDRAQLEARNLERKQEADAVAEKLEGQSVVLIRQAGTNGQLYGSVTSRDIAEALTAEGFSVARSQVLLNTPIKAIGMSDVIIRLHAEVEMNVAVNVARSDEEAIRQAAGEDIVASERDEDLVSAEDFFEDTEIAAELNEDGFEDDDDSAPAAAADADSAEDESQASS